MSKRIGPATVQAATEQLMEIEMIPPHYKPMREGIIEVLKGIKQDLEDEQHTTHKFSVGQRVAHVDCVDGDSKCEPTAGTIVAQIWMDKMCEAIEHRISDDNQCAYLIRWDYKDKEQFPELEKFGVIHNGFENEGQLVAIERAAVSS